ncbi:bifunctional diguanylate cyclase/phosphodiesterase [Actinoplanes sp. NEAU-A12]|uniref:Bifunctional diguanylate cyclase/phosphodiesterase n=1 Tax=Actinoplanes sandaracinus TaxID=3045177 RepID=A0ABT6WJT5_9ACTN|nr:bifunctional diguanylate cyclase/phosphodiesterase [Actinoplanes sandaracinus]MDI6099982.1 bifunctional diguanylate cyclase/phosphodiesterase [Actinoplanes sandaracinus]
MHIHRLPAWQATLAGGTVAVLGAYALDSTVLWLALPAAGTAILLRTAVRHRCSWWLHFAAALAGLIAAVWWSTRTGVPSNTPAGLSLAVQYALAAAAAFQFGRLKQPGSAAEAGAVVLCVAMLAWSFVVLPYLGEPGHQQADIALAALYAVLDLALLATVLRNLADSRHGPARLLATAGAVLLAAHLVHVVAGGVGGTPFLPGGLSHLMVQFWWVLVAAAALHPGSGRYRTGDAQTGRTALIAMYTAAVASPLLPAIAHPIPAVIVPALLTSALCGLLLLRIVLLARLAGHRAGQARQALDEQRTLQRRLAYRAGHDGLTGLANRDLLLEHLGRAVAGDRPYALVLCALDGFKEVNDTYGHTVGDTVLRQLAGRLLLFAPEVELVARLGGDEFGILITAGDITGGDAAELAERVVAAVAAAPFAVDERRIPLTARAGLADGVPGNDAVLGDADLALRAAKQAGGARVARFDESLRADQSERARIAAGLREALADGTLFMHYQPVVDTATGRITGVEALMRWRRDGELVPPAVFIPVAEQTGLIGLLGHRALRLACEQAAAWHREHGLYLTVNVSTHQLRDPGFGDSVLEVLAQTGLPAGALVLEITESVLIDAADTPVLGTLRAHGVRIAIDDFGTGYSSLAYLHTLPVDILKIDQSFIRRHQDPPRPQDVSLTRAILELARSQDLLAVAEGVETAGQADLLRELNCPLVQGYHFGRPAPAEAIGALLREAALRAAA